MRGKNQPLRIEGGGGDIFGMSNREQTTREVENQVQTAESFAGAGDLELPW